MSACLDRVRKLRVRCVEPLALSLISSVCARVSVHGELWLFPLARERVLVNLRTQRAPSKLTDVRFSVVRMPVRVGLLLVLLVLHRPS